MYCVGEYRTPNSNLHLNQIDYLKNSFQKQGLDGQHMKNQITWSL